MKKKIYKIMGVALIVVLLGSLTIGLAVPAAADPGTLKWTKLALPKVEAWTTQGTFVASEGDYWATPGIDVGPIAISPDGDILFAAVAPDPYINEGVSPPTAAAWYDVLKSTDSGYSWVATGFWDEWSAAPADDTPIVDVVVSPDYEDDTTVFVATWRYVYQSVDGGKNFVCMTSTPEWTIGDVMIRDMDVALDDRGRLAIMVGTWDYWIGEGSGDVYVFSTGTGMKWEAQGIDTATTDTYDVLAVAFSPNFADDEGISAVVSDYDAGLGGTGTTRVRFSFAYIGATDPSIGWGADIGDGKIKDAVANDFDSIHASIGFPDDFDAWGIGNNVCFVGVYSSEGYIDTADPKVNVEGDVYKIVMKSTSSAIDLDIRGVITTLLPTATDITTIQVCGDAADATIIVGTDYSDLRITPAQFLVYRSDDGGETWIPSGTKSPTGGDFSVIDVDDTLLGSFNAKTYVLMSPDFCDSGIAYAATWGDGTSAFSRTSDGAETWDQISIIDYGSGTAGFAVVDLDAAGYNAADILHMTTQFALTTLLSSGIDASVVTIPVDSTAGFPPDGVLIIEDEKILYTGTTATTFTGCDRGYDGTTAATHADNTPVVSSSGFGAVWKRTEGKNWERIWSYASMGVTDDISELIFTSDETMFAIDYATKDIGGGVFIGYMWRSSDNGATWPKKITSKANLSEVVIVSPTTLYTGHSDGNIYWSTKSGTGWIKPDDSEIPDTRIPYMVVVGDKVLIGSFDGMVFVSSDGGETIEKLGLTNPGGTADIALPQQDLGFADNDIIYCTIAGNMPGAPPPAPVAGAGVWRCEVDWDDPGSSEWVRIDDSILQPVTDPDYNPATVEATAPAIALPPSGVLYVTDGAGGLWRSANPTADVDGAHPPYFEKETKGLVTLGVGLLDLDVFPTVYFCAGAGAYYNQVVMFTDTLDSGVTLADPGDAATGVGLLPAGQTYPKVKLIWEEMVGAISYQWQIAIDSGFKSVVDSGYTTSLISDTLTLSPNKTYYWRARVANENTAGDLVGSPLISPWATTWKFKTAIGATMARPDLEAPWAGEPDVSLSPTFEWSGIEWAETYEFELSTSSSTTAGGYFTDVLVSLTGTNALVSTAWKCDIALDYETRYYWHVKAFGVDTETPWSDVGTFTTMAVPAEPVEPGPPLVIPPVEEITPMWIWVIIGIGAALMIAVVILIVTTRRVP